MPGREALARLNPDGEGRAGSRMALESDRSEKQKLHLPPLPKVLAVEDLLHGSGPLEQRGGGHVRGRG